MESFRNIWMLSFECAGIIKVGGLAEVPYNQSKQLVAKGFNVTIIMPSHGAHKDEKIRQKLNLKPLDLEITGKLRSRNFLPYKSPMNYALGVEEGMLEGIRIVMFKGLDDNTSRIMDDPVVYRPAGGIEDKATLLARGLDEYIRFLAANKPEELPQIIHMHDHHSFPAGILAKQRLEDVGRVAGLVLTIHLICKPRVSWSFLGKNWAGIENKLHKVYLNGEILEISNKMLLRRARRFLEVYAGFEADMVTSVSQSYLRDVLKYFGAECECKASYLWNGCDWNPEAMLSTVEQRFGNDIRQVYGVQTIKRPHLRRYLLTKALGNLEPNEPILVGEEVASAVSQLKEKPYLERGRVEAFAEDGPLVLITGRLAEQKGVDILFDAIPKVLEKVSNAKFLMLLLPTQDQIQDVKKYGEAALKYPGSVRLLYGNVPSIYFLAHLAGDVYVAPSRWEPFGIMALEAMVSGMPVVATRVGGLQETVIDVRDDERGTGLLVKNKSVEELAEALVAMIKIMQTAEAFEAQENSEEIRGISDGIPYSLVKQRVLSDPAYGSKLRENCIKRVQENFRWSQVVDMTVKCYEQSLANARLRSA